MTENNDFNYIFKFTWVIENFSLWPCNILVPLESPEYTVQNMDGSQWFIQLRPEICNGGIFGQLHRSASDSATELIEVKFKIEIEDSKNKKKIVQKEEGLFWRGYYQEFQTRFSIKDLVNKSSVKDSLTIRCFMTSEAYKNEIIAECFARTKICYDRICFKWTLCGLDSATFSTCKTFYYHKKHPMFEMKIETNASEEDFKIFIYKLSDFKDFRSLTCQFKVPYISKADEISERRIFSFNCGHQFEFPMFLKKSVLKKKHSLSEIIYCKMDDLKADQHLFKDAKQITRDSDLRVSNDVEQMNNSEFSAEKYHTKALIEDISAMLNNNTETDVILKIGKEEFPAHKCVLSTRSPVFKVMFEQDMSEKKSGLVQIQDLGTKTLKGFLEYLYTGAIKDIDADLVHKLLLAAEKYQVEPLKKLCVDFLIPALSVKNVCEYLLTADMVSEQTLKTAAINYIKNHVAEVVSSPEWLNCAVRNVDLSVEVMRIVHSMPQQHSKFCS